MIYVFDFENDILKQTVNILEKLPVGVKEMGSFDDRQLIKK